jgi:dTDP-4-dehydrorhamnose 3,5-epimerase-like enzyme
MIVSATAIPGVMVVEPKIFGDDRGWFMKALMSVSFMMH